MNLKLISNPILIYLSNAFRWLGYYYLFILKRGTQINVELAFVTCTRRIGCYTYDILFSYYYYLLLYWTMRFILGERVLPSTENTSSLRGDLISLIAVQARMSQIIHLFIFFYSIWRSLLINYSWISICRL